MKRFRRLNSVISTFTVKELIEKLSQYPADMPVFGLWESVHGIIDDNSFYVEIVHKGNEEDAVNCLLIDVESY